LSKAGDEAVTTQDDALQKKAIRILLGGERSKAELVATDCPLL
jgi:hypothetical protein